MTTDCPICDGTITFKMAYALWDDKLDNKLCPLHKEWIDAISEYEMKKEKNNGN